MQIVINALSIDLLFWPKTKYPTQAGAAVGAHARLRSHSVKISVAVQYQRRVGMYAIAGSLVK